MLINVLHFASHQEMVLVEIKTIGAAIWEVATWEVVAWEEVSEGMRYSCRDLIKH